MLPYRIKIKSILKADKISFICFSLIIGSTVLFLIAWGSIKIFDRFKLEFDYLIESDIFPIFIITCTIIAINLLGIIYRYFHYQNILNNHVEVRGIIKKFFIIETEAGNYNNIEITYEYFGKVFNEVKSLPPEYKIPLKLKKDAEITVLINPKKPKQFLIADLYVNV